MRWDLMVFLIGLVAIPLGCLLAHGAAQMGLALAAVFVASWVIELLQMWVPGRHFCWRDMAANAAGVLCAGACLALLPP